MRIPIEHLNAAGEWFVATVPRLTLEVGALTLVLLALDMALRGRIPATLRYGIWLLLLIRLAVPLSVAAPTSPAWWLQASTTRELPALGLAAESAGRGEAVGLSGAGSSADPAPATPLSPPLAPGGAISGAAAGSATSAWSLSVGGALLLGWGGMVFLLLAYLVQRNREVRRILARGAPARGAAADLFAGLRAELGVGEGVTLRLMPENHTPFVSGLWRPVVAVPAALFKELDPAALRAVIRHELCHLKRGDLLVNCVQVLLQVLHFFNPFLWYANRRIRLVREEAVDEMTLMHSGKEADMYPQTLIEVARRLVRHPLHGVALLGVVERRTTLRRRIEHMLARPRPRRCRLGWGGYGLLLALGALLLPMGAAQQVVTPPQDPPKPQEKPQGRVPRVKVLHRQPPTNQVTRMMRMGIDWLARNQRANGSWAAPKGNEIGVTGLAVLAIMKGGNSLRMGPYRDQLKLAITWLREQQQPDGLFGAKRGQAFMYNHLIASLAMCRIYGLSKYKILKSAVQKAVNYVCLARNPYKAWRYYPRDGDNDTSVTTWAVCLLHETYRFRDLGLRIDKNALKGARTWFQEMTDPTTGRIGYITRGSLPARQHGLINRFPTSRTESMTAAGLYAGLLLGRKKGDKDLISCQVNLLMAKPPVWNTGDGSLDLYYWYYATLALQAIGGKEWQRWRTALIAAAAKGMVTKGEAQGSWPATSAWGAEGGRGYSTALMVLALNGCRLPQGAKPPSLLPFKPTVPPAVKKELTKVTAILATLPPEKAAALLDAWLPQGRLKVLHVLSKLPVETAQAVVKHMTKAKGPAYAKYRKSM